MGTKVTSAMKSRTPLDERSFEQLLAAAYLVQQQREPLPFPSRQSATYTAADRAMDEADRLAAIAEAHTIVHGNKLRVQDTLQLVTERALKITGGAGAAIWLVRGANAMCQAACGVSAANAGQSIAIDGSRLTPCFHEGAIFRCDDAKADPRTRYDALPGVAQGSIVAVPIHHEGRVQGALEVSFAQVRGFKDADVRTCQILSGLVSETVAVAAGQEQKNILESERATLLDALDRLQPHLSKLLSGSDATALDPVTEAGNDLPVAATEIPPRAAGPAHGLARLGKYLMAQQKLGASASPRLDLQTSDLETSNLETKGAPKRTSREVHTALNFSVTSNRPSAQPDSRVDDPRVNDRVNDRVNNNDDLDSHDGEIAASSAYLYDFDEQPFRGRAVEPRAIEPDERESNLLELSAEPWSGAEANQPAPEEPAATVAPDFWNLHWTDVCLAVSALLLAASLTWAVWPQPKKMVATTTDPSAVAAEPKLTAFEELLVTMGLAEAPPPPATYTGAPGTRVWVDLHNALYYCPGAEPYGKTPKGKFMTQHDAQAEQFQPARGQPCD